MLVSSEVVSSSWHKVGKFKSILSKAVGRRNTRCAKKNFPPLPRCQYVGVFDVGTARMPRPPCDPFGPSGVLLKAAVIKSWMEVTATLHEKGLLTYVAVDAGGLNALGTQCVRNRHFRRSLTLCVSRFSKGLCTVATSKVNRNCVTKMRHVHKRILLNASTTENVIVPSFRTGKSSR